MTKTLFVSTAMMAAISEGVHIRESLKEVPFYEEFAQYGTARRCTVGIERNWNTTYDYSAIRA